MKIQSGILTSLGLSLASSGQLDERDANLQIGPLGLLTYTPPFVPNAATKTGVTNPKRGTCMAGLDVTFAADLNEEIVQLLEGSWDVLLVHQVNNGGGVDFTAKSEIVIDITGIGTGRLSSLRPYPAQPIAPFVLRFPLTVSAKNPVSIRLGVENGAGTATGRTCLWGLFNRLI